MSNFKTWLEAFETPSDFLLNPKNKQTDFNSLLMQFQDDGGHAEYGKYGTVLISPKWPYVIKIFPDDPEYTRFARFAYKNPHPSFPKIYGPPQKIIPFFKRTKSWAKLFVVRIEKLMPVQDKEMMTLIIQNYQWGISFFNAAKHGLENREFDKTIWPKLTQKRIYGDRQPQIVKVKEYQHIFDLFAKYPQIKNLYQAIYIINISGLEGSPDIHAGNVMQRKDGELVLIDPLWAGSNPYMDALAQQRMEIDGYSSDFDEEPEQILGGELPKKKKIKPYKAAPFKVPSDDVPF